MSREVKMEIKCINCKHVRNLRALYTGLKCGNQNSDMYNEYVDSNCYCKKFEPFVEQQPNDPVNHPSHYTQGKVECIDAIESATINKKGIEAVCTANVIKYLWRYEDKNGLEDLKKAEFYLNRLIEVYKDK